MEQDGFENFTALLHCAVYVLVRRGTVVYIGQSRLPIQRLYSHIHYRGRIKPMQAPYRSHKVGFQFDEIWIRPCMLGEVDGIERDMIRKYKPKHNTLYASGIPDDLKSIVSEIIQSGAVPQPPSRPTLNIRRRV